MELPRLLDAIPVWSVRELTRKKEGRIPDDLEAVCGVLKAGALALQARLTCM